MLKYIKWELKDFFKRSIILLSIVAVVYLLFLVLPFENKSIGFITGLVTLLYILIILGSFFGSYFMGTLRVVNTFSKKTFLLESMIPTSVEKLLLAKYVLGIIINIVYIAVGVIGISLFLVKGLGVDDTFEIIKLFVENMDGVALLKFTVSAVLSSVTFMSVIVLCYVGFKSFVPNSNNIVIGIVVAILALYVVGYVSDILDVTNANYLVIWGILLAISAVAYFFSTLLIKNKLEIYS